MNKKVHKKSPILVVKPSVINALVPLFIKSFFVYFFIFLALYFLVDIVNLFFDLFNHSVTFFDVIVLIFVFSFLSISVKLVVLRFTTYYFYDINAIKEFKLVVIKRRSVVYNRITNITLKMSVWDRITFAGKIILHTGDDEVPDLVMDYIKNPRKVEDLVYSLIHKKNEKVKHEVLY